jgi:hypothetical protein
MNGGGIGLADAAVAGTAATPAAARVMISARAGHPRHRLRRGADRAGTGNADGRPLFQNDRIGVAPSPARTASATPPRGVAGRAILVR